MATTDPSVRSSGFSPPGIPAEAGATNGATRSIQIQTSRDALGREYTINHDNVLEEVRGYNLLGQLNRISTRDLRNGSTKVPVSDMRYNARGQRVTLLNGGVSDGTEALATNNRYDPLTYRMSRTLTRSRGGKWQDLAYQYDLVGNILQILDSSDYELIFGHNDLVSGDQHFIYDSTYRLIRTTGREHPAQVLAAHESANRDIPEALRRGQPSPNDTAALVRYHEEFDYDSVGNLTHRKHKASLTWTQHFEYEIASNRLRTQRTWDTSSNLTYDNHGNATLLSPYLTDLKWNHNDHLLSARQVASGATASFAYCAENQRAITSEFGRTRIFSANTEKSDGFHSIGLVDDFGERLNHIEETKNTYIYRHQINDQLGSPRLEVSANQVVQLQSFEEYFS